MRRMYDFETEEVREFLEENDIGRAAVQLPPGLRPHIGDIKETYEEQGVEVLFLSDTCYGACDVADERALSLGCDGLVHYGHTDMGVPTSLSTLYVEARVDRDLSGVLEKALPELGGSVWGLTSTVQHIESLEEAEDYLEGNDIETLTGDPGPRSKYPGQVLGCDWGSARSVAGEVDGFIYLGTGDFHPRGIVLATDKPVFSVNSVAGGFERVETDLDGFLKKRYALLTKAKSGDSFGVIVSTKKGQDRFDLAENLAEGLEDGGYESYVLVGDEISPGDLKDYQLDAFVNTACPRIPIDDSGLYGAPILTPFEARVLLGEEEWHPYRLDEIGINF